MNYKSFADLSSDIREWLKYLPHDFDLVVGVPRSGLLPANLIALYMNLPLADVDGLLNKKIISSGHRLPQNRKNIFGKKDLKILVIDDSVASGVQIQKIKKILEPVNSEYQILYAAVYVSRHGKNFVDNYFQILNQPRCFEWNIFHHALLEKSCVDIDGILCRDPTEEENDDGEKYRYFIENVKPYIIPTEKIGWLVSCRLEKYRELTEKWLNKHDVKYDKLIMMDLPDKKTRRRLGNHAEYKAKIYNKTKAKFFIESSREEAEKIAKLSGKDVYCLETNEIYKPKAFKAIAVGIEENIYKSIKHPKEFIKKIFRMFFGV